MRFVVLSGKHDGVNILRHERRGDVDLSVCIRDSGG